MSNILRKRHPLVTQIFERAKSPQNILLVPVDYAKSTHKVIFINGNGDELRQPFDVHNNAAGLEYLTGAIERTCKKRKIPVRNIIIGGEGTPCFARNFITGLCDRKHLLLSIHAKKAKEMRENEQASTDKLDLIGIGKCLMQGHGTPLSSHRFEPQRIREFDTKDKPRRTKGNRKERPSTNHNKIPITADSYGKLFADQDSLQILTRHRRRLVQERTACTNRMRTVADQLFPGFLDPGSPVCAFTKASLHFMSEPGFCAQQLIKSKPNALARRLKEYGTREPQSSAQELIRMGKDALPADPQLIPSLQQSLQAQVIHYQGINSAIAQLDQRTEEALVRSPASLLMSLSGIGSTLAAGIYAELGASLLLYPMKDLCSYSGIVPRVKQSGGPDKPARTGRVRKGCNRILKNYLVQAAAKMRDFGPEGLQEAYHQLASNGQHADFIIARRLLRIFKYMMLSQSIYLPARLRKWDAQMAEPLKEYLSEVREKIAAKWSRAQLAKEAMDEANPLGNWWKTRTEAFQSLLGIELDPVK
ncbi:MAG: transposase [Verrucomicrobia bacterium]|nr:transposase [Verrucomicrobiota bacterium]MDA1005595.1 transposase [Verrucomicrobiota bacterium]